MRVKRLVMTLAGIGVVLLGLCETAAALGDSRQTATLALTTTKPSTPTGSTLSIRFRDPANPAGKPYTIARIVVRLHPGSVIDTSVPEQCKATDLELMLRGAAACPAGSRVGAGQLVTDSGLLPPTTNRLTTFNTAGQVIGLAETDNPPTRVVSRSAVNGATLTLTFPALPGLPPPDPYLAYRSLDITTQLVVRGGRAYTLTPPTCPASGYWTGTLSFTYRDGVTQTVASQAPCTS